MKNTTDLAKSRDTREAVIEELGQVPDSILRYDRTDKAIDLSADGRKYGSTSRVSPQANGAPANKLRQVFDVSGQSCRGGALSRFPQNVGRLLLRLYSKPGDTVVDPFAGHNSRMEMCWRSRRNYIGHDISRDFMEANRTIAGILQQEAEADMFSEHFTAWIKLHECDSREMPTASGTGDFTITSPPYWDLEDYGPEAGQLGTSLSYTGFVRQLGVVAEENHRCLKPGAFCVWCVNDFRKDGTFYPFHEDTAALLRGAGFQQHDTLITDLGPAIRAAFASQVVETKIVPKRHEYCLVFRKKG